MDKSDKTCQVKVIDKNFLRTLCIFFPEDISLSIDPIPLSKKKAMGKRSFRRYLRERLKERKLIYTTSFESNSQIKVTGYFKKPEVESGCECTDLLPFNEFCQAYVAAKDLDDQIVIFYILEFGVICIVKNGIVESYMRYDKFKDKEQVVLKVKEILHGFSNDIPISILCDERIEALSCELINFEDKGVIKAIKKEQLFHTSSGSFPMLSKKAGNRKIVQKKVNRNHATHETGNKICTGNLGVAFMVSLLVGGIISGSVIYFANQIDRKIGDLMHQMNNLDHRMKFLVENGAGKINSSIDDSVDNGDKTKISNKENDVITVDAFKQVLDETIRPFKRDVQILSTQVARLSSDFDLIRRDYQSNQKKVEAYEDQERKHFRKALEKLDCVPEIVTRNRVVCNVGGDRIVIKSNKPTYYRLTEANNKLVRFLFVPEKNIVRVYLGKRGKLLKQFDLTEKM